VLQLQNASSPGVSELFSPAKPHSFEELFGQALNAQSHRFDFGDLAII
jgi:hypothetical protein